MALILKAGAICAFLATVLSALGIAGLTSLALITQPQTIAPSIADILKITLLLSLITVVSCGSYGFFAGVVGSAWLRFRRSHLRTTKRLLVEAVIAGFLLSLIFPWFDMTINFKFARSTRGFLTGGEYLLCWGVGIVSATVCAYVFRKNFKSQKRYLEHKLEKEKQSPTAYRFQILKSR
jgi:hypothetical protein